MVRQSLGYLIAGILLFFLIKPFVATHAHLKDVDFQIQWGWLVCSFAAILFYWSAYLYPFATLLRRLTEKQVAFGDAFTLLHLSNITRYLPGRVWGVVRLLSLAGRFGWSKTAVGSSLSLHVGMETALGGLIAGTLLFSKAMRDTATDVLETIAAETLILTGVLIAVLATLLFCIPKIARPARGVLKTLRPLFRPGQLWGNLLACHGLLWGCQALAFTLFVKSLAPVQWTYAGVLTACFAFAWLLGFVSLLTPGGLGVREALLARLLATYMPAPQATLIALLARLWMLAAEILLAGSAVFLYRCRPQRHTHTENNAATPNTHETS